MAETAKMGLDALKCIQMYIPQKGEQNTKNGKKWQKMAENFKISEIIKIWWKNENNSQKC